MGRDLVGDAALLHIICFRQSQMFLGSDIAQHRSTVVAGGGGAYAGSDVVVAREDIGDQRAEDVEGRAMTEASLKLHVELDLIEGHVARALDHHLYAMGPGDLGQLGDLGEFTQLSLIGGIRQAPGAKSVTQREADVVATHDFTDLVETGHHRVVVVMGDHPLCQQGSSTADDADQAFLDGGQVPGANAGVNGEVVDPLSGLMFEGLQNDGFIEILDAATDDHRVNRHGSDGHGAFTDQCFAAGIQISTGGKIHRRVRTPTLGPLQLLHLFIGSGRDRRGSHVGIDLRFAGTADGHRIELMGQVMHIGGNDQAAGSDLIPNLLRSEVGFALGDPFHLGSDNAQTRTFQLGDRFESFGSNGANELTNLRMIVTGTSLLCVGCFKAPVCRKEIPCGQVGRLRHPGSIRGGVSKGSTDLSGVGK